MKVAANQADMSSPSPDEARFEVPVEHWILRRFAQFVADNRLIAGLSIASIGGICSIASLYLPIFVIVDIIIDVVAAFLSVTFIREVISVTVPPVQVEASTPEPSISTGPPPEEHSDSEK